MQIVNKQHYGHYMKLKKGAPCFHIIGIYNVLFPVHVGFRQGCPFSAVLFIIFMDRISKRSHGLEGFWFGSHWISSLLFADDVDLLALRARTSSMSWDGLQPSAKQLG